MQVQQEAVREELSRILASPQFCSSPRLQRFLTYVVEHSLRDDQAALHEMALGTEVFDRGAGFDPRTDTIVRVEARRLRSQLLAWYAGGGRDSRVRIEVPRGGYVASFQPAPIAAPAHEPSRRQRIGIAAALVLVAVGVFLAAVRRPDAHQEAAVSANQQARSAYWDGRYLRGLRGSAKLTQAVEAFERAVAADPQFTLAWAGLANTHATLAFHTLAPPAQAVARATAAANRCLELDPGNAEAIGALAWIACFDGHDWNRAETGFRRALESPTAPGIVHQWYAFGLASQRRFDEAIHQSRTAIDRSEDYAASTDLSLILFLARRYEDSVAQSREVLRLAPRMAVAHALIGRCRAAQGKHEEALAEYALASPASERIGMITSRYGVSCAVLGRIREAEEALARLRSMSAEGRHTATAQGVLLAALGRTPEALGSLEAADRAGEPELLFAAADAAFDRLRREAAFQQLLRRMGLSTAP